MRLSIIVLLLQVLVVQVAKAGDTLLLRLHGSNTIGAELAPELVTGWLYQQGYSSIGKKVIRPQELEITARDAEGQKQRVQIHSHGSGTAFKALEEGSADIGMSSRPIKVKENNRLKRFAVMTDLESEHVIGLDGIAVIVNKQNPVNDLSKTDIKKIFSGELTHWSQINASMKGDIKIYARDDKSGTFDTFKSLVLGKDKRLAQSALRYESNEKLSDDVSDDLSGIGFVGLPYVRNAKAIGVAETGSLPKTPEYFDVATEDYALARRLYLYKHDDKNVNVKSFIEYTLSESGQQVVERTGFISQNLRAQKVELNAGFPEEYLKFTKGHERLSLNFRFKKGSTKLDNKAIRDVQRLVRFLSRKENKNRKVMLFGFAESSESLPIFSLDLSTYRVDWVSVLLAKNGIDPVRVRAYGDAIPVASNEDAGGRHKNRRVEVWLQ